MNQTHEEIEAKVRKEFKQTMTRMNNKDLSTVRNNPEMKEDIIQQRIKEAEAEARPVPVNIVN